jgi:cation:H+ antiporter
MNALIWVRQGKYQLALSNMSGSMMVQATIPSGLALLFTSWDFDGPLLLSGCVTGAAIAFLLVGLHTERLTGRWLAGAAGFYLVFAALLPVV